MFRAIPVNNKVCFDRELKRNWKIHEKKLRNIRSTLSQDRPQYYRFLDQRAKRAALEEVRNYEIHQENQCLLTKIKTIEQQGSSSKESQTSKFDKKKTLNEPFRKKQLVKIVEENEVIMRRILSKKSAYNVRKWAKERSKVQKNITLISEYPFKNYPSTQTKVNLWMTDEDFSKKSRVQKVSLTKSRQSPRLVYSGTQKISDNYYLVETYLSDQIFSIDMENLEDPSENYRIQMTKNEALALLEQQFSGQLIKLVNSLQINPEKGVCHIQRQSD